MSQGNVSWFAMSQGNVSWQCIYLGICYFIELALLKSSSVCLSSTMQAQLGVFVQYNVGTARCVCLVHCRHSSVCLSSTMQAQLGVFVQYNVGKALCVCLVQCRHSSVCLSSTMQAQLGVFVQYKVGIVIIPSHVFVHLVIIIIYSTKYLHKGHRGRDRMVVGFPTTCAIYLSPLTL